MLGKKAVKLGNGVKLSRKKYDKLTKKGVKMPVTKKQLNVPKPKPPKPDHLIPDNPPRPRPRPRGGNGETNPVYMVPDKKPKRIKRNPKQRDTMHITGG